MAMAILMTGGVDLALYLFGGPSAGSALVDMFLNIGSFATSSLYGMLAGVLGTIALLGAIIVGLYYQRSDFVAYATVSTGLIGMVAIYSNLFTWMCGQLSINNVGAPMSTLIPALICFPLMVYFMIIVIQFPRNWTD